MEQTRADRKTIVRRLRLSADEDEVFARFCESEGLTFSEALRRLVRQAAGLGPTFTSEARAEVVALTRQVRAIGVNLNQAVHHMNAGHVVKGEDVKEWLTDSYQAIIELDALYRSLCARSHRRAREAMEATAS